MNDFYNAPFENSHDHVFLGVGHEKNERKTWGVIVLCSAMMIAEIIGGTLFGSLALVADGLHMSTHAGAMLIAALAYTYARKHVNDRRFVFGTGKLGDLAGFASAIILAMIAMLIAYEALLRLISPVPIHFEEAIPIAVLGLMINILSAWLLSGGDHHGHSHGHLHGKDEHPEHHHVEQVQRLETPVGVLSLSIFEEDAPPVFRIRPESGAKLVAAHKVIATTIRADGTRQVFAFTQKAGFFESSTEIPEPHCFKVLIKLPDSEHVATFEEHHHLHDDHHVDARDHNMRAAYVHVIADAAVSVLTIIGLMLAKMFGWLWMDPLAGIVGALVIANWSYGLIRDTGAILLDVNADNKISNKVRAIVETEGDTLMDLHVWRLGPGHFGAVISLVTEQAQRSPAFYHAALSKIKGLSHITVEINALRKEMA